MSQKDCLLYFKDNFDQRIYAIYNKQKIGVGGSVLIGYKKAIQLGSDLVIKIDSDGQMDLSKLLKFLKFLKAVEV